MTEYNFYTDPGHGWLEVPRAELKALGILSKVSGYSYQKGNMVYLEEDCDLSLFCDTRGAKRVHDLGRIHDIVAKHSDSPIRNYPQFTHTGA